PDSQPSPRLVRTPRLRARAARASGLRSRGCQRDRNPTRRRATGLRLEARAHRPLHLLRKRDYTVFRTMGSMGVRADRPISSRLWAFRLLLWAYNPHIGRTSPLL